MIVAGVDEAGRGSIIGPLVVSGISASMSAIDKLRRVGVKDSKQLSPAQRSKLYPQILKLCENVKTEVLAPSDIDRYVEPKIRLKGLNYLEAKSIAKILSSLDAEVSYVDSCDINPRRFAKIISSIMEKDRKLVVSHHADEIYTAVSAASIVAKVTRDKHVQKIGREFGDVGSGYPSDAQTIEFLQKWVKKEVSIPPFARRSWKTWLRITPKLDDFTQP
ncbi:MAG: ribonuclease HII [Thaumarchaeota archaeon]|nr:ribonuclease HII [Nitrososphaerota archaeon]